jgi:uncharacterized membrane protein YeaQ/YmgE (transglycosylase-associated protein family)
VKSPLPKLTANLDEFSTAGLESHVPPDNHSEQVVAVGGRQREWNMLGIESIIVFLIVGAIAGWLAGVIVKGFGFGLLGNIVVGIVGAFIAGWLFPQLGWGVGGGFLWAIVHATIGAVILLVLLRIVRTGT